MLDAADAASRGAALAALEQQRSWQQQQQQRQQAQPPSAAAIAATSGSSKVSIRMRLQGRNRELTVSLTRSAKLKGAFDAFVKSAVERG